MAEITASLVRELRDATNLGMMECKKALVEVGGDKEEAIKALRERGLVLSRKRASRAANQGIIASTLKPGGSLGSLIEVNCETDFVARNEMFKSFVEQLSVTACDLDDGALADAAKDELAAKIAETGENMVIRRNTRYIAEDDGIVASYIHPGAKLGAMLEIGCDQGEALQADDFQELVKDLAMHVAAADPTYLSGDDVPAEVIAAEREIFAKQVEGKPANIVDKIVDGKMKKFLAEICLLDQAFVKEPKQSITDILKAKGQELKAEITIRRFARFQLGQE
jgi:elongation factor Ts